MAKTIKTKAALQDVNIQTSEYVIPTIYTGQNQLEIIRVSKITRPTKQDMDSIFSLYKLYVNSNKQKYETGCSCSNNISNLYFELLGWYDKNKDKFPGIK